MSFLEFKSEDEETPGLAVRVEIERAVHPALERILHDEVQSVKMLQHVTLDRTADQAGEGALDALSGQRALEPREILRVVDPDIDVRGIALVAGARVRDVAHQPGLVAAARAHATRMSTRGLTLSRSISTDFVITQDVIEPRKPPPPAGPQHNKDSTSHSMISAGSRPGARMVTCSRTSCASAALTPALANSELTPMRSMRISPAMRCTRVKRSRPISAASRPRSCAPGPA